MEFRDDWATFVEVKKWRCLNNVFLMTLGSKMVNFRSLSLRKSQVFQITLLRGLKKVFLLNYSRNTLLQIIFITNNCTLDEPIQSYNKITISFETVIYEQICHISVHP